MSSSTSDNPKQPKPKVPDSKLDPIFLILESLQNFKVQSSIDTILEKLETIHEFKSKTTPLQQNIKNLEENTFALKKKLKKINLPQVDTYQTENVALNSQIQKLSSTWVQLHNQITGSYQENLKNTPLIGIRHSEDRIPTEAEIEHFFDNRDIKTLLSNVLCQIPPNNPQNNNHVKPLTQSLIVKYFFSYLSSYTYRMFLTQRSQFLSVLQIGPEEEKTQLTFYFTFNECEKEKIGVFKGRNDFAKHYFKITPELLLQSVKQPNFQIAWNSQKATAKEYSLFNQIVFHMYCHLLSNPFHSRESVELLTL